MQAFPWLRDLDLKEGFSGKAKEHKEGAGSSSGPAYVTHPRDGPALGEEDLDALGVHRALDDARAAMAKEPKGTTDDYRTSVLGGGTSWQPKALLSRVWLASKGLSICCHKFY